jgi:LuxR family transcriptional regulator, activator of conjugal transfer of Ti plasmids
MDRVFHRFVKTLSCNPDSQTLRDVMEQTAAAFELRLFACLFAPRDDPLDVKLISNYPPDWTGHYLAHGYDRFDPVISNVRDMRNPFEWGGGTWPRPLERRENELMEEASVFGIRCGFTFPLDDPESSFAAVTFASDYCLDRFRRCFDAHRDVLKLIAYMFHAEARRSLAPPRSIGGIMLTYREFECLDWACKGKSAWDTSQIIGISRRTVAFHLHNAKMKLGVRTIQQAVALFAATKRTDA